MITTVFTFTTLAIVLCALALTYMKLFDNIYLKDLEIRELKLKLDSNVSLHENKELLAKAELSAANNELQILRYENNVLRSAVTNIFKVTEQPVKKTTIN